MKKLCFSVLSIFILCSGCAYKAPQKIQLQSAFDAVQAEKLTHRGNNTILGNAFLRQKGGGVVTCAGSEVRLIPATEYAKERLQYVYLQTPYVAQLFTPDESKYYTLQISTRCDSQGNFVFENIADGEFFVTTTVYWSVGYASQGGALLEKVEVAGGESKRVILAR